MQLPTPMVVAAQQAVNRILDMDTGASAELEALYGKVIQLHFSGLETDIYLMFVADGIEIMNVFDGEIDTVLSGSPAAMASLYSDNSALFNGTVGMSGDVKTGRAFKALIAALDLDWEEQLAGVTGDAVAHRFVRAGRELHNFFSTSLAHLGLDSGEYLQEEVRLLAPNSEIQRFCHEVDELLSDVDRLDARINQVAARRETKEKNT